MNRPAHLATVGLMIGAAGDREILSSFLQMVGHAVVPIEPLQADACLMTLDLLIVDERCAGAASEALQAWKQRARPKHLPMLVLLPPRSTTLPWLRSGFDDVLHIPIAKDELLARVEAVLRIRRASEQAERDNEERFRLTVDRAPIGIAHCSLDGRFLRVNRHLCEILHLEEAELKRLDLDDLTLAADAHLPLNIEEASDESERRVDYEVRHCRADGELVWLHVTLWRSRHGEAHSHYIVAIVQDVTERREMTERLGEANLTLERRVEERTAELQAANEELEAFSASVSHDLRAPLRTLEGFADLLIVEAGNKLEGRAAHLLVRLRAAATRMSSIIDGLLALSRASRGALYSLNVDLAPMARELIAELATEAPARSYEAILADDLTCRGDPVLLRQVVDNLIRNAWKYSSHQVFTRIELGTGLPNGDGQREFFVRDNGAGFDPAYADGLFKPFERLHSESEFPGVGLGLATVQRIIGRHGGRIRAESAPKSGATFFFTLPAPAG